MMLGWVLAAALATLAQGATSPAPPPSNPTPQDRQRVVDLAYTLGEAHALHRACAGSEDNTWRGRMSRLLQVEAPPPAFRQRLMSSFNAGFLARTAEFPACTPKSQAAEQTAAAKGRDLARRLASGSAP